MATRALTAAALALMAGALAAPASAASVSPQLPLVVIDTEQRIVDDPKADATMRSGSGDTYVPARAGGGGGDSSGSGDT